MMNNCFLESWEIPSYDSKTLRGDAQLAEMKLMLSIPLACESVRQAHTLFLRWDENSTTVGKGKYLKQYFKKVPDYGG